MDAMAAVDIGADALGFIFAPSPRRVTPERVRMIITLLPPFVKTVGVFVDEKQNTIKSVMADCGLDMAQLHGSESPAYCQDFMPRALKAFRIRDEESLTPLKSYQGHVRAILLDTYAKGKAGGTGKTFDWHKAVKAKGLGMPLILAGGLSPANIEDAILSVQPYGVDIGSGVEKRPGQKDHTLLKELMRRIKITESVKSVKSNESIETKGIAHD